jgi:hypothetical protein
MRPWAEWTAKTALVAAGFAAVGGSLSGVAQAGAVAPLAPWVPPVARPPSSVTR